jgi:hypothetical protein
MRNEIECEGHAAVTITAIGEDGLVHGAMSAEVHRVESPYTPLSIPSGKIHLRLVP